MADTTTIEWCDATFNPWTGCTKVSPGCDHCYAEGWSKRAGAKVGKWGPGAPRVRTTPANWRHPIRWNAEPFWLCGACGWRGVEADMVSRDDGFGAWIACPCCHAGAFSGARRRVFCASLADVFDNEAPPEWRADLFELIHATPNLDWLLLTKRIGNVERMVMDSLRAMFQRTNVEPPPWPWSNVWLGATIVNQDEANRDIPKLLAVPARVRFLSLEPLLGPVDLTYIDDGAAHRDVPREEWGSVDHEDSPPGLWWNVLTGERTIMHVGATGEWSRKDAGVNWVIVGGESGHGARPMHPEWARRLRYQCAAAGVPFLFKQWGEWAPYVNRAHYTHGGEEKFSHCWIDDETCDRGQCWIVDDDGTWSNWTGTPRMSKVDTDFELHTAVAVMGRHGKKHSGRQLCGVEHNGFPRGTP